MKRDIIEANPKMETDRDIIIDVGTYWISLVHYEPHGTPYLPSASFHAISAMEACSLELRHEHGEACLEERGDMM